MTQEKSIKQFFEQVYGKKLAYEDVLEYKNRLVKFFDMLTQNYQKENVTYACDTKIILMLIVVITQNNFSRWTNKQKTDIEKPWHQTWWGILILTIIGEIISGLLLYFMGII